MLWTALMFLQQTRQGSQPSELVGCISAAIVSSDQIFIIERGVHFSRDDIPQIYVDLAESKLLEESDLKHSILISIVVRLLLPILAARFLNNNVHLRESICSPLQGRRQFPRGNVWQTLIA